MRRFSAADSEFIHLLEMCIDAEERYERRCRVWRERGEHEHAAEEAELRDKYACLKEKILQAMNQGGDSFTLDEIGQLFWNIRGGPNRDASSQTPPRGLAFRARP